MCHYLRPDMDVLTDSVKKNPGKLEPVFHVFRKLEAKCSNTNYRGAMYWCSRLTFLFDFAKPTN